VTTVACGFEVCSVHGWSVPVADLAMFCPPEQESEPDERYTDTLASRQLGWQRPLSG